MRRAWLGVAALTACGRFGFSSNREPQVADARADASPDAAAALCATTAPCGSGFACASDAHCHPILFEDHFDGATIDAQWSLMRFEFALQSGELATTPTVRTGFDYGQGGNGRSAVAAVHIGDPSWTDVRIEWTQQSLASLLIVDGSLPPCQHTPSVFFRMESYSESWNAPQNTNYGWSIDQGCDGPVGPTGSWGLGSAIGVWIPGLGYSSTHDGDSYTVGSGLDPSVADAPVHFVIEAVGPHISIWADGTLAVDLTDTTAYAEGESAPTYGGVGFSSAWEQMFWIDDVVVSDLTR